MCESLLLVLVLEGSEHGEEGGREEDERDERREADVQSIGSSSPTVPKTRSL